MIINRLENLWVCIIDYDNKKIVYKKSSTFHEYIINNHSAMSLELDTVALKASIWASW
jgi:hypothetical protein